MEADVLYNTLLEQTSWEQGTIKIFGKDLLEPRLKAWFGTKAYTYSGITHQPSPLPTELEKVKQSIEELTQQSFNSCLINLYRDGSDSMGWHQDNEKELGENPTIASLSLGAERVFHLKQIKLKSDSIKLPLAHGSLLVMSEETQHFWKHQLPKTKKVSSPRINLTFRFIH